MLDAGERVPRALVDLFFPGFHAHRDTGRAKLIPVTGLGENIANVANGRMVRPTVASISALTHRDDLVLVPIEDMPPVPLGLMWRAADGNARIHELAGIAAQMCPAAPPGGDRPVS